MFDYYRPSPPPLFFTLSLSPFRYSPSVQVNRVLNNDNDTRIHKIDLCRFEKEQKFISNEKIDLIERNEK